MKISLSIALFLCTLSASWAHDLSFDNYLKMQKALANDDYKSALVAHKVICEKELGHYTENYTDCGKALKNIEEIRSSFKSLSKLFIGNGKTKELNELVQVHCSMAKADWVQEKGHIKNPYFGKSMLKCGSKLKRSK